MALIVVLVVVAGLVASGLYLGWITTSSDDAAAPLPACAAPVRRPVLPQPKQIAVNVYNASTRAGLATSTGSAMKARGFAVRSVANDPRRSRLAGSAVVRHGARGVAAATVVAGVVPGAKLQRDARTDATVDLVVGTAFRALKPVAAAKPAATKPVTPKPSASASARPTPSCTPRPATPSPTSTKR